FSDLVGFTALSTRMDPEDLREVISSYQKCVAETVQRFGGFVANYMGDGVLVYFGYPKAREDDAERWECETRQTGCRACAVIDIQTGRRAIRRNAIAAERRTSSRARTNAAGAAAKNAGSAPCADRDVCTQKSDAHDLR